MANALLSTSFSYLANGPSTNTIHALTTLWPHAWACTLDKLKCSFLWFYLCLHYYLHSFVAYLSLLLHKYLSSGLTGGVYGEFQTDAMASDMRWAVVAVIDRSQLVANPAQRGMDSRLFIRNASPLLSQVFLYFFVQYLCTSLNTQCCPTGC